MKFAPLFLACLATACGPSASSSAQDAAAKSLAPAKAAPSRLPAGAPRLSLPIACTVGETCALQNHVDRDPGPDAKDYRCGHQTYEAHGGVDIRLLDMAAQRAGVDVLAAAPGRVSRLRDGVADVSVKSVGAASVDGTECGNGVVIDHGGGWETQYCHLAKGSLRVKSGDAVTAGQPIARVGLSGNTEYPHVHLTVRRDGVTIDPFAPSAATGACDPAASASGGLWDDATARMLAYRRGVVLNAGFSAAPTLMEVVEAGGVATPTARSAALVAYVRAINLEGGDVQELVIKRPDGTILAQSAIAPLDRAKAQYVMYAGKRAPADGWARGAYTAVYSVRRDGQIAVQKAFEVRL